MDLVQIISQMNHEVKGVILGFLVDKSPRTAESMHRQLSDMVKDPDVWIPNPFTIYEHLYNLWDAGIVASPNSTGRKSFSLVSEQLFSFGDYRYSAAAMFLLRWVVQENQSLFSIFGHAKGEDSSTKSSVEHRLTLLHVLYDGEKKTITEICHETGLGDTIAINNLGVLANAGLVDLPKHSVLEGNTYQVVKPLREYFFSQLPPGVRKALSLMLAGREFTVNDIHSSVEIGREEVSRQLRRMEKRHILKSRGRFGTPKYYYCAAKDTVEEKVFTEFLCPSNLRLLKLFQQGLDPDGNLGVFHHSDLYPYFKGISRKRVRDFVTRLEERGYVVRTIDCKKDKTYSLTPYGVRFIDDCLLPLKAFFDGKGGQAVIDKGRTYFQGLNGLATSLFVEKALRIYGAVSPYLKREEIEKRAQFIMGAILGAGGEISRKELLRLSRSKIRNVIDYLTLQRCIESEKRGLNVYYVATSHGRNEYSHR